MEKEEFIVLLKKKIAEVSSGRSYQELSNIVRDVRYECVTYFKLSWEEFDRGLGRNLHLSANILNRYREKASEKVKLGVLEEFKKEYLYDLDKLIFRLSLEDKQK